MKNNFKKLATAALALAGLATTAPAPGITVQDGPVQTTQKANKDQAVKPVKSARQYVREDAGGMQVMSYGVGIPPHIYGQYYVRRGTHKRTNKRA